MKFNKMKLIYWTTTGLLSLIMLGSASMYLLNYEEVAKNFSQLGFNPFIIYPLAVSKVLGITAILTRKSELLKEWAYVGFFFNFLLAFSAHLNVADGQFGVALISLILLLTSYYSERQLRISNSLKLKQQII